MASRGYARFLVLPAGAFLLVLLAHVVPRTSPNALLSHPHLNFLARDWVVASFFPTTPGGCSYLLRALCLANTNVGSDIPLSKLPVAMDWLLFSENQSTELLSLDMGWALEESLWSSEIIRVGHRTGDIRKRDQWRSRVRTEWGVNL